MSKRFAVSVLHLEPDDTVPGRFSDHGLWEVVEALGGTHDEDTDVDEALRSTLSALKMQQLGEQLLDHVLVNPPIPAGCEALLRRMTDPDDFPWVDHEVTEDRFWLWYAHRIAHRALPETFPAPPIRKVVLEATPLDAGVRAPGKRTAVRDRTRFVTRLLAQRPDGDNPIAAAHGDGADGEAVWAFDVVWGSEVLSRRKPDADELASLGVSDEAAGTGRVAATTLAGWLTPQWVGDLAEGASWVATLPD